MRQPRYPAVAARPDAEKYYLQPGLLIPRGHRDDPAGTFCEAGRAGFAPVCLTLTPGAAPAQPLYGVPL